MQCKSLWIKASAKCVNVNVLDKFFHGLNGSDVSGEVGMIPRTPSEHHIMINRSLIYITCNC